MEEAVREASKDDVIGSDSYHDSNLVPQLTRCRLRQSTVIRMKASSCGCDVNRAYNTTKIYGQSHGMPQSAEDIMASTHSIEQIPMAKVRS